MSEPERDQLGRELRHLRWLLFHDVVEPLAGPVLNCLTRILRWMARVFDSTGGIK